jgi:outer membrane lipoprotein SlyB
MWNRFSSSSAVETIAGTTMAGAVRASIGAATLGAAATAGVAVRDGVAGTIIMEIARSSCDLRTDVLGSAGLQAAGPVWEDRPAADGPV